MKPAEALTRILIIDDNPVDVQIIRYALQEADWPSETTVATDGEEAINLLSTRDSYENFSRPDLIILDLNLPKRDGIEVLRAIRVIEELNGVPVVILSCYSEELLREKARVADISANCYLTKPSSIEDFSELGRRLRECCATSRAKAQQTRHA